MKSLQHRVRISQAMRHRKVTLADALKALDDEEDRIRAELGRLLTEARLNCSPEFADRVEKHLRDNDMLPRPEKQN